MKYKYGTFGFDGEADYALPTVPTGHRPGTIEKMTTMQRRFEKGEHLYHPSDNSEINFEAKRLDRNFDLLLGKRFEG